MKGLKLGFVPTMGALHEGHVSLVKRSLSECDLTLVSVFVNPTQFNDPEDLKKYPRDVERDLAILSEAGVEYALFPNSDEIYPDGYRFKLSETGLSSRFCGAFRPGHFDGVLTVVMKLLQIADAERAYFGEKDYQQYLLIREMAEAFFLKTEIVPCPIIRETDGLAMSSRNALLGPTERAKAPALFRALSGTESAEKAREALEAQGFGVDYVEDWNNRRFAAVKLGNVRLIDNVQLG